MLIDLTWTASPALLVVVTAAYATALLWLLAPTPRRRPTPCARTNERAEHWRKCP